MAFHDDLAHRTRRVLVRTLLASLVVAPLAAPLTVQAQAAFPSKPVKLIVPFPPGSSPDVIARLVSDRLAAMWGQTFVIENKPGAGGIPGMSALARSANDGHTLGFIPSSAATTTPLLYKNPQFDIDKDVTPVALVATSPLLVVTQASSPIKNLADLAKAGQATPGKLNFAAAQPNSLPHLAGEVLNKAGQMGLFFVPYPGAPAAITAVIAGDATVTVEGVPGIVPHIKAGRLRALAVTSAKRLPGFDDIPTVAETYPGYEMLGWFAFFAPAGTPQPVMDKINRDVAQVMQTPELVARLADLGIYPRTADGAGTRQFVAQQRSEMKRVVDTLGLKPE